MALVEGARLDRIREGAEPVHVGRAVAMVVLGVFWLIGAMAAYVAIGLGWARSAVVTGWQDVYTGRVTRGRSA